METLTITIGNNRIAGISGRLMAGDECELSLSGVPQGTDNTDIRFSLLTESRQVVAACVAFSDGTGTLSLATEELALALARVPTGSVRRLPFEIWLASSGVVLGAGFADVVALPVGAERAELPEAFSVATKYVLDIADADTIPLKLNRAVYRATPIAEIEDGISSVVIPTLNAAAIPSMEAYYCFELEITIPTGTTTLVMHSGWTWLNELPTADFAGKTLYIAGRLDCMTRTVTANFWRLA